MSSSPTSLSSTNPTGGIPSAVADRAPLEAMFPGLMDVIARVTVRLGTGAMTVADCLELKPHSIVTLVQPVGQDLDVSVNGEMIARGEVVIVEDSTSIRLTDIVVSSNEGEDA
jgi:flagellar motor switch protein FliN